MNVLDMLKTVVAGIKWPAVKWTDFTSMTIQELALAAIALLLLYEGSAFIRSLCGVALTVVAATLAYRFISDKFAKPKQGNQS